MARYPRNVENENLPNRWQFTHGAFYYRVPPGQEPYWCFKKRFLLGRTFDAALDTFTKIGGQTGPADVAHADKIVCRNEIIESARPAIVSGVYFLIRNSTIVYVGRSENVYARLSHHTVRFDSFHVIPAVGREQERLEQIYIARFRPMHNVYCGGASPKVMAHPAENDT